ncbi:MAG: 16S rRNA (guanine(966)-N(2))-methyltransferase RsmD [Candidatus Aminicenantes bacterium]|nr:16S rRNA (guanine(966)-N(2))-methyltransferase RsmD [Candidatus Aminicenantes bacterium]
MIRVISGVYRGKRLRKVPSPAVRPYPDKLKTALFNILREALPGKKVLDGFAGTGSVGIEALSNGASFAVFVEILPAAVSTLRHNLAKLGAEDCSRIVALEFNRAVIRLAGENARFDFIFLDPPYRLLDERNPLKVVFKRGILASGGRIVLRRHFKTRFASGYFDLEREVRLGDDVLCFYRDKPTADPA